MLEECRDQWPEPYKTKGPLTTNTDRERRWNAWFVAGVVELRKGAVLGPGEDLTEYPPTVQLDADEWAASHADYGLDADGEPL